MKWKLFSVLPGLLLAHAALATDPLYVNPNWAVLNYVLSQNPPPTIDGRNFLTPAFDNEGTFGVTFDVFTASPQYFEAWNMLYYTNNGTMLADSSCSSVGFLESCSLGCGFQFDLLNNGLHSMAGTFYNAGTIDCNSRFDPVPLSSYLGSCLVTATNVVNPGVVNIGQGGLIQFTGQNVDLTGASLNVETPQELSFNTGYTNMNAFGTFGTDTNAEWNPGADLGPNFAYSSWSGGGPYPYGFYVNANPATSYFQFVVTDGGTNWITRAVFIQNTSPNAPYNVFFNGNNSGLGSGEVNIEWIGTSVNPAACNPVANYLYLNNNYVLGAATNNQLVGGVPNNFTFTERGTRTSAGALATAGFYGVFADGAFSNQFAYVNAQFIPASVPTNASSSNPSGALTNLPGRIQISASKELNLALARIIGPNYLSLTSTNQFDGNAGVQIIAPYSDIHLGVTNGSLTVTNLLPQTIPSWSGTVQAWSTRWLTTFSNTVDGINFFTATNDIRVMIVNSRLVPTTTPQVQDLILHATNSLVLCDAINILRSLSIDAQNLTLTTNGCGNGALSLDGELNLESPDILWQSALPNVRNLTNNGAIHTKNLCVFGGPRPANYTNFINHGLIADQGTTIYANNFLSSGIISNGVGSFLLQSLATVLTNGAITAGGDVTITSGSLVTSNLMLQAGRSLTLQVTNFLTDDGVSNGSLWSVGGSAVGGSDSGFNLLLLPTNTAYRNDLLGTTVTDIAPPNKHITNIWAGRDYGVSPAGYTNNMAIGRLILDSRTNASYSLLTFNGTGVSNAIYVDELELLNYASYTNHDLSGNLPALFLNTNQVIYYAQALTAGGGPGGSMTSVAEVLNHKNNDHLRWVWAYAGHFSSTNILYPDGNTYGPFNAALRQSTDIDSDGDGLINAYDSTPFFVPSEVNFTVTPVNRPPPSMRLQWKTIPLATNYIQYRTNLLSPWLPLTNFDHFYYGANVAVTNSAHVNRFVSPQSYPGPVTNVWVFDATTNGQRYYRVLVSPWLTYPF
jgi:hypothetical protein